MNNITTIPQHVAIVMDGNGRWAKKRFLPRSAGHAAGQNAVEKIIKASIERGIGILTLFAFSSENWRRPTEEIHALMNLFMKGLTEHVPALHEKNIRIRFIGHIAGLSLSLQQKIAASEALTLNNTGLQFVLAMNYGGQLDIVHATQRLALAVRDGALDIDAITPERFNSHLYTTDLAPPDLFIRTSGELRLSNFLLWQLAYSELYFTEVLWPDFNGKQLDLALSAYATRKRRYGSV